MLNHLSDCEASLVDYCYYVHQGAKLNNANLKGANLQRAYLRHVNLRDTVSIMKYNYRDYVHLYITASTQAPRM